MGSCHLSILRNLLSALRGPDSGNLSFRGQLKSPMRKIQNDFGLRKLERMSFNILRADLSENSLLSEGQRRD